LGGCFYRLLKRREVVSVTSRMVDFGKQNRRLLRDISIRIGSKSLKLKQ
jgi:hypothetical protein